LRQPPETLDGWGIVRVVTTAGVVTTRLAQTNCRFDTRRAAAGRRMTRYDPLAPACRSLFSRMQLAQMTFGRSRGARWGRRDRLSPANIGDAWRLTTWVRPSLMQTSRRSGTDDVRTSDVACRFTRISQPCGHRFSGDLTGFGALASKGRCVTGIRRADTANVKNDSILHDQARDGNGM
jgi:hypothetical protein